MTHMTCTKNEFSDQFTSRPGAEGAPVNSRCHGVMGNMIISIHTMSCTLGRCISIQCHDIVSLSKSKVTSIKLIKSTPIHDIVSIARACVHVSVSLLAASINIISLSRAHIN